MLRVFCTESAFTLYRVPARSIGRVSGPKSLSELAPIDNGRTPQCSPLVSAAFVALILGLNCLGYGSLSLFLCYALPPLMKSL
jgi:hypothetical protein